jgi:hypothetical protein
VAITGPLDWTATVETGSADRSTNMQAFAAAALDAGPRARSYLARLRRRDGSYRYSVRYVTTPLWVTAEVLPALLGKPFPLR